MQFDSTTAKRTSARSAQKLPTLVLTGPTRLTVERGRLKAEDGYGNLGTRRLQEFEQPLSLETVILLSDGAFLSDHALRLLSQQGAVLYRLRQTGELEYAVTPQSGAYKGSLLRMQARLWDTHLGLKLAKELVTTKIERQEETLAWLARRATLPGLEEYVAVPRLSPVAIQSARNVGELMLAEAQAADRYFDSWIGLPIAFRRAEKGCIDVPIHWKQFQGRSSLKSGANRHATDPVNALLNFGYGIASAESMIAIRGAGLDPSLGVLHADKDGRASFVYDVIEPLRPRVDRWLLKLVEVRAFKMQRDFVLLQDGVCRLGVELAAEVAQLLSVNLRPEAQSIVLQLKKSIISATEEHRAASPSWKVFEPLPEVIDSTPATEANKPVSFASAPDGAISEAAHAEPSRIERESTSAPIRRERSCQQCGKVISGVRRYCRNCCSLKRSEVAQRNNSRRLADNPKAAITKPDVRRQKQRKPRPLSLLQIAAEADRALGVAKEAEQSKN